MKGYQYDPRTGEFIQEIELHPSPEEEGKFLVPVFVAEQAPPAAKAGHARQWRDGKWHQVEDHRGVVYRKADGAAVEWVELGALAPEFVPSPPPEPVGFTWGKGKWIADKEHANRSRRADRDGALKATDWLVLRHRDEVEAGLSTTLTAANYQALQAYRAALRALPQDKAWPWVELPEAPVL